MNTVDTLKKLLAERILVLDGAMGTMVQRHKLSEADFRGERFKNHKKDLKGNNDVLVLTRPDVIAGIHAEYLAAGADIIETNTFSGTSVSQGDYGLEALAYEINFEATKLAKIVAAEWTAKTPDQPRFVAGSLGPTTKTLSISPDVNNPAFRAITFDEMREAFKDQARGLVDGGSDLLLVETQIDTLNAKAALVAIAEVFEEKRVHLPVMVSATLTDRSGRTLSGQTLDAFYLSIEHVKPFSVGLNCALGAKEMRPYLAELSRAVEGYVSCYPNAGLPNAFGQYDEQPAETAGLIKEFAESGFVNIIGGCCGTTPDHIREIAKAVEGLRPRETGIRDQGSGIGDQGLGPRLTRLSGLEPLTIRPDSNFQMIGERTNVTGSKKFERLVKANDWAGAAAVAVEQVRGGANIIDVNMDEGMLDSEACMTEFLNYIATEPEIARVPVMVDSSKWSVIEAGLKCVQGKAVVNSISLKEGEADFLNKAKTIRRYGAADDRDGVRRERPGRHRRAQGRDLQTRIHAADRDRRRRSVRHHFRSEHPRHRDRPRRAQRLREVLHRGDDDHQASLPRREDQRRRQQPVVLLPGERRRPRGDSFRVPVPRHQSRHGHGHCQRRAADRLRGHPEGSPRARRGHHLQPAARCDRAHGHLRRTGEGVGVEAGDRSEVARRLGRGAAVARARARHGRFHRAGRRRSARQVRAAAARHRRTADGRHEGRRRAVWRGQMFLPQVVKSARG